MKNLKAKEEKAYAFVTRAIALQNVKPEEKQLQSITLFVKRAILDVNAGITKLENEIANRKLDKETAELLVEECTTVFDNARSTAADNTADYLRNRNEAKRILTNHKNAVLNIDADIASIEAKIVELKEVLADLEG